jgi:Fe-S-cluster containining protein
LTTTDREAAREGAAAAAAAVAELRAFYADVDREFRRLAERFAGKMKCGMGCTECCQDGLTVFAVEAENIRSHHAEMLGQGPPGGPGACALLDGGGRCRVYPQRPYICRTHGLPLRVLEENGRGEIEEHRSICPLNGAVGPLDRLPEFDLWLVGPFELRLGRIQERFSGGALERAVLRDLFGAG